MRGELLAGSLIIAGAIFATCNTCPAATITLPTDKTTLYLQGDIQTPFWVTFTLDADIQLLPPNATGEWVSHYILNINLSNTSSTTAVQFAKIYGGEAENGLYGPDGPPRLLFSDAVRTLSIDPQATFSNALLQSATLRATLPDGLFFTSDLPAVEAAAVLSKNPLPAAVWLFGSTIAGACGIGAWRRRRVLATKISS